MTQTPEGTVQFAYDLRAPSAPILEAQAFAELSAWRQILRDLNLIGQDPARYDGYGFGNMSLRDDYHPEEFVITASQTSGEATLDQDQLVRINNVYFDRFWVDATGTQPPSSEALTHAMIYASDARLNWVLHVHCPVIWQHTGDLTLPHTDASVGYGTAEMASAVATLLQTHQSRPILFTTLGHEDGVFAAGHSARDAGSLLVTTLARALAL